MAGQADERRAAVEAVAEAGWTVHRVTKRGYLVMHCACGRHAENLHKTPSRRDHFKDKVSRMLATCDARVG